MIEDLREGGKDLESPGYSDERLMDELAEFIDNAIETDDKKEVYFDTDGNNLIFLFNKDFNLDELNIEDMKSRLSNLV